MPATRKASSPVPLLYADTHRSADQLYCGKMDVHDPFISMVVRGRRIAVLNALELGRGLRESAFDAILPLEEWEEKARKAFPGASPGPAEVIALLARSHRIRSFLIPPRFPAGVAFRLRELGVALVVAEGVFFPQREVKDAAEVRAIRRANRCAAAGLETAARMLRASRIRGRRLYLDGSPLTSERVKAAMAVTCLQEGGVAQDIIVAGGDQACDPHGRGTGPLRPGELIVVDVFPRDGRSGYYGDMTRTFLRGRASEAQRALVAAVGSAQRLALGRIRAGVKGCEVHAAVQEHFRALGYETVLDGLRTRGFFHGTGHGLGLDIHEPPRMSRMDHVLRAGAVVTVEPGLYYPGLGGCRIEDVVQVASGRPRMLSCFPKEWELR